MQENNLKIQEINAVQRELNGGFYWIRYNNEGWIIGKYDKSIDQWFIHGSVEYVECGWIDEVGERIERSEKPKQSELKKALGDKIKEFEGSDTIIQSRLERIAIAFTLDQLKYLDSIVEYE